MRQKNPLQFPHRGDFTKDDDAHQRNLDHLERWAAGPKDWMALVDHEELPPVEGFPEGTLVQHQNRIYRKRGDAFVPLVPDTFNDFVVSWSFTGNLAAATDFLDTHPLNIPFDGMLTKAFLSIDPAVAASQTVVVDLRDADDVVFFEFTFIAGETRIKERLKLGVQEDTELFVNVLSSAAIADASITLHLTLRKT